MFDDGCSCSSSVTLRCVKGGLNLSKASFSKDALKGDNQTGWFIGPMAEFTLPIIGVGAGHCCFVFTNRIWLPKDMIQMLN